MSRDKQISWFIEKSVLAGWSKSARYKATASTQPDKAGKLRPVDEGKPPRQIEKM